MDPILIGLLAGAGTGLAKSYLVDKPQEQRDRTLAAATERWSPWTHQNPKDVKPANPIGDALQFGVAGGGLGANISQAQQNKALSDALTGYYNRGGEAGAANLTSQGIGGYQGLGSDPYWGGTYPNAAPTGKSPWSLRG